jgi:hypothetical protein
VRTSCSRSDGFFDDGFGVFEADKGHEISEAVSVVVEVSGVESVPLPGLGTTSPR